MRGAKVKTLSLCEKLQLIEEHEQQKRSARELAVVYGIGKTQVYETLKNKDKIKCELLKGTSGQRKRLPTVSPYEDIHVAVWEWFTKKLAEGTPISGPMIQAEALRVALLLGKTDFKASNGWLESFRARYHIVYNQPMCVEAKDVIVQLDEDWRTNIPKMTEGYREKDIFILHEIVLFYKTLSSKLIDETMGNMDRLGVLLCTNMKGTLLQPIVVGKVARPKQFGNLDSATLPVVWRSSSEARMTGYLLEEWLHCFNETMKVEDRTVVLFLDNIEQHHSLTSMSNVKVVWCQQPLDQGVYFYFKCLYRRSVLQWLLLKIEESSITELCKSINLLDAVNWIARATKSIPPELVKNCFIKSGFTFAKVLVFNEELERETFNEIIGLCQRLNLDIQDVLHFDDSLLVKPAEIVKEEPEEDQMNQSDALEDMPIKTYSDAVKAVNDLEKFATYRNCPELLNLLQEAKNVLGKSCLNT